MGSSKPTETSSASGPPAYIQQHQVGILNSAQQAAMKVHSDPFAGPFLAQPNAFEKNAVAGAQQNAQSTIGAGNSTLQYGRDVQGGKFLDPNQNQALKDYINMAVYDPTYSRLTSEVLPQIESGAIQGGAYGGGRDAIANIMGYRQAQETANAEAARAGLSTYGLERGFQDNASTQIARGLDLNAAPYKSMMDLGAYDRSLRQIPLDEKKLQFEEQNTAPFRPILTYADLVAQMAGGAGGTWTGTIPGKSKAGAAVAGGLSGAAAGAATGAAMGSAIPVWGTAAGALIGAGLGAYGASR